MKQNFIVANLGDNDFGYILKDGLVSYMSDKLRNLPVNDFQCKHYLIGFVVGKVILKNAMFKSDSNESSIDMSKVESLQEYLQNSLSVEITDKLPTIDHDGGSAYYDLNLDVAYTF